MDLLSALDFFGNQDVSVIRIADIRQYSKCFYTYEGRADQSKSLHVFYNDYYRLFGKALKTGLPEDIEKWLDIIADSSTEAVSEILDRVKTLRLAKLLDIQQQAAWQILPLMDELIKPVELDIQAASQLLDNYRNLARSDLKSIPYIVADIDDEGIIRIIEGLHRTVAAFVFGRPVRILFRSVCWGWKSTQEFFEKESVLLYGCNNSLYQSVRHPVFSRWNVIREDRLPVIINHMTHSQTTINRIVDFGCHVGTYTHRLSEAFACKVVGIEREAKYFKIAQKIAVIYSSTATFVQSDVVEYADNLDSSSGGIAICLSVIYHLYRDDPQRCRQYCRNLVDKFDLIYCDDEPNTGILTIKEIVQLFTGCEIESVLVGVDNRTIFCISSKNL